MARTCVIYLAVAVALVAEVSRGNDVSYIIATEDDGVKTSAECAGDDKFKCDIGKSQCIASSMTCDGVMDCKNGRDESVEDCGCLPHEFQCNSSHCIDLIKRCDLSEDCEGGVDEEDCETFVCALTHFKCANHMCVPRDMVCDYVDDCGDNSDESHCTPRNCDYGEFRCDNFECTKTTSLCDGVQNCKDGSDEDLKHCAAHFQCPTGFYVAMSALCDGWQDCTITHADEAGCGDCRSQDFQCDNDECVSQAAHCDGICDCIHCDDEMGCDATYCDPSTYYLCQGTNRCIKHRYVCDGVNNCKNTGTGIDEYFCHNSSDCSTFRHPDHFLCPEGRCLPKVLACNHYWDCLGGEDEEGCAFSTCAEDQFECDNHKCVALKKRCDTVNDCLDWSDEKECHSYQCPGDHVRCSSGQCLSESKWCDHWPHCPDSSDESKCDYRTCGQDEFTCSNGECVPLSVVCYNGRKAEAQGCMDKSHLIHCENYTCGKDQFKCRKSFCIDQEQLCDGSYDCLLNYMDEAACEYACPYGLRICRCFDREMNCEGQGLTSLPLSTHNEHIIKFRLTGNFFNATLTSTSFSQAGPHMDSVTYLDLSNNSVSSLPDNMFQFMWKLKYLNLGNNSLTVIRSRSFAGLKNLTQLYLGRNKIQTIQNGSFLDIGQLTTLDLSYQNLSFIGPNTFLGLHRLHLLNLSGNNIQEIHDGAFIGLQNLLTLDLSSNQIENIGARVFYGIPRLSYLVTDEYRFCCLARSVERCLPEPDEFSSCEDLMSNHVLRISIWVLGLLASVGNLVVIVWRARDVRGRKVHSFLITNLALGDLLMGVYLIIIAVVDSHYRGVYMLHDKAWRHSALCQFAGFISTFSSELSVLTLTIITLDRLICIILPLRLTRLSVRDASIAMLFVWLLVFVISALPLVGIPYFQNFYGRSGVCLALHVTPARPPGWQFSVAVFLVFNFISFLIIAGSYIWMFLVARETRSAVRSPETKSDAAMARRMTLIVMTDFVCWVPIILLGFASLGGVNASNYVYAWIAVFILPLNSAVNPILYTLSTAPFMGNVRKRAYRFRKSFMTSVTQETKHSYVDDRTLNSYSERKPLNRPGEAIRMKTLRTSLHGQPNQYSSEL